MNAHDIAALWLRWFWPVFFIAFGAFTALRRRYFGSVRVACCGLRIACTSQENLAQRILDAIARRERAEGPPTPVGLWIGGISIVLGVVAIPGSVQPALLYALLCLGFAFISALAYWRLRNTQPMRFAILSARNPGSAVPSYWFIVSALSGLSLLVFATLPAYRISAVLVSISMLATTFIAWRLTMLPALLSGADLVAEQIVDDRVRSYRSSAALFFAAVQAFVFCSEVKAPADVLQLAAFAFSTLLWIAFGVWIVRRLYGKLRLA